VADEPIQAELRAQVAAGTLPQPNPNILYVVFTPPQVVVDAGRIGISDFVDVLQGADGTRYLVQKVWNARNGEPMAFAAASDG
jgi:hypothetical protein